ncbi:protein of unknown function [Methanoculleus bourgensis]|uniref:Uncharacterized protein n=1 Tax=Methanoculleus bourgensis TaxID=83986 RepID=A0A110BKC9_9EURY|nr:protein of unknown function [Methanoculleus bourgensis]
MVSAESGGTMQSTARLQWSHVFSDMVRCQSSITAMRPGERLQWSHVFSDMVRAADLAKAESRWGSFNGAMSFQTW